MIPVVKYRSEWEMTFTWVQKAADGPVCKLWHHCTQCATSQTMKPSVQPHKPSLRSISNELQCKAKQDFISISKKISSDILGIEMFFVSRE